MMTLIVLAWLFSVVPAFSLAGRAYSSKPRNAKGSDSEGFASSVFVLIILYCIGWLIYVAMANDLQVTESQMYDNIHIFRFGIVCLGANSIIYWIFKGARTVANGGSAPSGSAGGFLAKAASLIGLIASFLGIIAFFWDHFSKK